VKGISDFKQLKFILVICWVFESFGLKLFLPPKYNSNHITLSLLWNSLLPKG